MRKYERVAGVMTRGETYAKLNETLIEAEELCAVMAHLHNTEDGQRDKLLATGWRGVSQLLARMRHQVTQMAMNKLQ